MEFIPLHVVIEYCVITYLLAVPLCRYRLAREPHHIDQADYVVYTVAWILSPVWMPFFLIGAAVFIGVKHKKGA